jgi:hypothetical protein
MMIFGMRGIRREAGSLFLDPSMEDQKPYIWEKSLIKCFLLSLYFNDSSAVTAGDHLFFYPSRRTGKPYI